MKYCLLVVGVLAAILQQVATYATHKNVWYALTEEEIGGVNAAVHRALNLTQSETPAGRDNYLVRIQLIQPNKTDVLSYFDGQAKEPARYARATVAFGAPEQPYYQEYSVGPLPATNNTAVEPLTYLFNNEKPGRTNVSPIFIGGDVTSFIAKFSDEIKDITQALWNTTLSEGGITFRVPNPLLEDGRYTAWAGFLGNVTTGYDSLSLLPLGVSVRLDLTSRNYEDWNATAWYCLGKVYPSTSEFRAAVLSPDFQKPPPNVDGDWTTTKIRGDPLPFSDTLPPPLPVSQGTPRFSVNSTENHVSWMDFSFYMTLSSDTGLSLFDITYKNQRIIYELALQEAMTLYTGSDPTTSSTTYFDSADGLGSSLVPLVKGYDCPAYATYLNASFASGTSAVTIPDAICLFEFDAGYPIRRHTSMAYGYASVTRNIAFIARTVSTVGNYDFIIEYSFYLDGGIEVAVRASGYIISSYWEGGQEYGFHVHDHLSGSLHDHVIAFKADIDVLGTRNSVQRIELRAESVDYPWSSTPRNTFAAHRSILATESESAIDFSPNDASVYTFVNTDAPNKYGEYRGYRIRHLSGMSHLTATNASATLNAARFADNDMYITHQHDSEPRSSDRQNQFAPQDPLVDFSNFLNDESIQQEDIVLWFNLGMHHVPHTGDLPNTMFTQAHAAMRFEPFNYLDGGDPSVGSVQQERVLYGK
ncbi:amine oxidase catalytic domain-containing protein [Polyplosphaeria fusca]|uniref:Amine oxidase n=1 Tax=Polyplosphaeria fusca TaxID=682080 RepID=A0A9P4QPS5_9PLEO|nr:amine oxidase catalytic domain-containing protein [Polyplosphaeria fusca]